MYFNTATEPYIHSDQSQMQAEVNSLLSAAEIIAFSLSHVLLTSVTSEELNELVFVLNLLMEAENQSMPWELLASPISPLNVD